jgi:plasmid replication initiation protein
MSLTKNYVRINLSEVSALKKIYSIRLYEACIAPYKEIGNCSKTVEELRFIFGTTDKYVQYGSFKRSVMVPAINEINNKTHFDFT